MLKDFFKDRFIPHEKNDFRPDFLERASMGIMLVLVLLTFAIANIQALVWISSEWMVSTILPAVIVELTNEERADGALGTLKRSGVLDSAAKLKAEDMAKNAYFAHYSPAGISPWYWFDEVSYNFIHAGENLAVHFSDSSDVVEAWMDSPTHRANIMNESFTEIGVGTAKGQYDGESTVFVVQLFGTPSVVSTAKVASAPKPTPTPVPETEILGETTTAPENELTEEVPPVVAEAPEPIFIAEVVPEEPIEMVTETTIDSEDGTKVMYSDLATTSREGVPAITDPRAHNDGDGINPLERTATQPGVWLQIVYGVLAVIVVVALILSIVIEWRRQNPIQIAYAGVLIAVMALLFELHSVLTGVTIV